MWGKKGYVFLVSENCIVFFVNATMPRSKLARQMSHHRFLKAKKFGAEMLKWRKDFGADTILEVIVLSLMVFN